MICPYICHVEQTYQDRYEIDENGQNTFHEHKLVEQKIPMSCGEAQCAAWQDGKCQYRGE